MYAVTVSKRNGWEPEDVAVSQHNVSTPEELWKAIEKSITDGFLNVQIYIWDEKRIEDMIKKNSMD